jgi:hypothetical protein
MRYIRLVYIHARTAARVHLMGMTSSVFRRRLCGALLALAAGATAHAQSAVYKCVDENGRVEYTDVNKRGCKMIEGPTYIAAPPARRGPPAMRQGGAQASVGPASFPRVDSAQQRARDDDRREILNDELRNEQKKLADQKRDFNNGEPERQGNERNYAKYQERVAQMRDDIGRTERNIEALQREIANIR